MTEKQLVNKMKTLLKERGAWVTKTHGSSFSSGLPDLVGVYKGRFLGLEVKLPTTLNTVSARQSAILEQIRKAGGYGRVVSNLGEVEALLDKLDLMEFV
jgi:Holliday junction resolvase